MLSRTKTLAEPVAIELPSGFFDLVHEISSLTRLPQAEVERRIWAEALQTGHNVLEDVARFHVTPHVYSPEMEQLYREGDGFIFETLVFWMKPTRQKWTAVAMERLRLHAAANGIPVSGLKILMLGDGTGSDALLLAKHGFRVVVFDVPGSKVMDFAIRRFRYHGVLGDQVRIEEQYQRCLDGGFDAVLSFEVLEHLNDPPSAIRDVRRMLKKGGIALITEAFGGIDPYLPTHLIANRRYFGHTAFLFCKHGMRLRWYNREPCFKPMEFIHGEDTGIADALKLLADRRVFQAWMAERIFSAKQTLKGTLHVS
jgi:2-polyprenyl-3-methyl-5-hydroxy-6-metoxy-1,4-benzoquinol methylase